MRVCAVAEIFTLIFSFEKKPAVSVPWKGERAEIATHAANQSYIHNAQKVEVLDEQGKLVCTKFRPTKKQL